ncbi:MAG TPA: HPr family phosphocarrier protein [Negativicutes bacterium]|nr:HPr family phosphocarrier protein [Negativicutes bacterium]
MEKEITILNKSGLHARPAAVFVKEAIKFKSDISIERNDKKVNAKSMLAVLSCGLEQGAKVRLIVVGEDEAEAMAALVDIVQRGLGEE